MSTLADPVLEAVDLRKYFPAGRRGLFGGPADPVRAVDGVSLALHRGETVSLVGESGCGKTTTSRMLLLLERPTSGSIRFHGAQISARDREAVRRFRSAVQAVFQDPWSSMNPRMRIRDVIAEPLVVNGNLSRDARAARVAELLSDVGLAPNSGSKFPHEFSGGQRQRIAVARALALQPEAIILDEPVSALDVSIRAQIMNLLSDLQARHGLGYLVVAHDLATVRYLSKWIVVMYLGKIVERAPSEAFFGGPQHPYSLSLLAAAQPVDQPVVTGIPVLKGDPPSPATPPSGCSFHPRCWLRQRLNNPDLCVDEEPVLRVISKHREVACHFAEMLVEGTAPVGPGSRRSPTKPAVASNEPAVESKPNSA